MKKAVGMILAIVLLLGLTTTSASALTDYRYYFDLYVQCVNETDVTYLDSYELVTTLNGRVYVYHTASPNPATYTNLFHITKQYRHAIAQKFCTQGLYVPAESNLIVPGMLVGLSARGNTKYHDNFFLTNLTLSGYYGNY